MIHQEKAKLLAESLLDKHGLKNQKWQIQFNKSAKFLGQCWHDSKVIVISTYMLAGCSEAELTDTLLHEIAHALVGPGNEHNETWKNKAREIGCTSNVCGRMNVGSGKSLSISEVKDKIDLSEFINKLESSSNDKVVCPKCKKESKIDKVFNLPSGKKFTKLTCSCLVDDIIESANKEEVSLENWRSESGKVIKHYQVEGVKNIIKYNGKHLIADEPALGKTVQALGFLKFVGELSTPALVICGTKLKIQWVKEALDWCGVKYFGQTIEHGRAFIIPGLKLYITSRDLIKKIDFVPIINDLKIKTIIVDEIQHFKNTDSARTIELRRLVKEVPFFIPLSGTPWKNRGDEFFPVLNMLDPQLFPSVSNFENTWVDYYIDSRTGKYKKGGLRNIPKFRELTSHIITRRLRKDVLPELPSTDRSIRYVELEELYGESYEKAESRVAAIVKDAILEGKNFASIASEMMRLKHITGLAKLDATFEYLIEWIENSEDWEKMTVFHHHIDVGDLLQNKLDRWLVEEGYSKVLRIKGGEDPDVTEMTKEKFKADINSRIMLASTLASGEGLNLQFCRNALMMERQWNPANEEQAELRFSRPVHAGEMPDYLKHLAEYNDSEGKKISIPVPYMICAGTIDEDLTEIVERKRVAFRQSMNEGDENLKWDENEIMNELAQKMMKRVYGKRVA